MKHLGRWSPRFFSVIVSAWELDEFLHYAAAQGVHSLRHREGRATRECLFRLARRTPAIEGDFLATAEVQWHDLAWLLDHFLATPMPEPSRPGFMRLIESWALPRSAQAAQVPEEPASAMLEAMLDGIEPTDSLRQKLEELRALEQIQPTPAEREQLRRVEGVGLRRWLPSSHLLSADRDDLALVVDHLVGTGVPDPQAREALSYISAAAVGPGRSDMVWVDWQHAGMVIEHMATVGCPQASARRGLMRWLELWAVESPAVADPWTAIGPRPIPPAG